MKAIRNHGFTMVELLTVTAIVGILTALGLGAVRGMLGRADATKCLSNLRQAGAAVQLFAGDHNGSLPATGHLRAPDGTSLSWTNTLVDYLSPDFFGKCPSARKHRARVTYGWNDLLTDTNSGSGEGIRIVNCRTPSGTMVLAESADNQTSDHFHFAGLRNGPARITPNQFRSFVNPLRHGRSANYLFVDGHAETLSWTEVQRRLAQPGNSFLIP